MAKEKPRSIVKTDEPGALKMRLLQLKYQLQLKRLEELLKMRQVRLKELEYGKGKDRIEYVIFVKLSS